VAESRALQNLGHPPQPAGAKACASSDPEVFSHHSPIDAAAALPVCTSGQQQGTDTRY